MTTYRDKSAVISACQNYRYVLWRSWGPATAPARYVMFIGLNPSTADGDLDDPTIRRCVGFARGWGYDTLCMTNLFALRATDPRVMLRSPNPIGPENDWTLAHLAAGAGLIVAAWGGHGTHRNRDEHVRRLIKRPMHHLGLTKGGQPKHPLYLESTVQPTTWLQT